jgi:GntR family transcriptional regulator/MocR family aminotransferase
LYKIKFSKDKPIYLQLYSALKDEITTNYAVKDKLPSIRELAELNNISKTTVQNAYNQLFAEGYIYSKAKSGYYVSDFKIDIKSKTSPKNSQIPQKQNYKYDFFPAKLNNSDFPLKTWRRLSNKALGSNIDFSSYSDGAGNWELRVQIANYLNSFRGTNSSASEIVITHGFSDSLSLVAKLLKPTISSFAMEYPGYRVAREVFSEYGYKINKITLNKDGLDINCLQKSNAKLVYTTPSHQYPTGVIMPISNRLKLIQYMQNIGGYILEDDYDSELKYSSRPIPSMQGLAPSNTIYLGTFAKVLSPAIRVGFIVFPKELMSLFNKSYEANFSAVCEVTQKTLALFMQEGHFSRHLRKVRKINKIKHNLTLSLLQEHLKDSYKVVASGGGLAILIMPTKPFDFKKFKTLAEKNSIKLYFTKERSGTEFEALRLGFGGFSNSQLKEAIEQLSHIWHKAIKFKAF